MLQQDPRTTPIPSSPVSGRPVADLGAYRRHRDARCGKSYKFMPEACWRATYSLERTFAMVRSFGHDTAPLYDLGHAERAALYLLMVWHERNRPDPAGPKEIAKALGVTRQSAHAILTRLGRAGVLVNLGAPRAQNLAVNPHFHEWNLELVRALRNAETASIRVRDARRGNSATSRSRQGGP